MKQSTFHRVVPILFAALVWSTAAVHGADPAPDSPASAEDAADFMSKTVESFSSSSWSSNSNSFSLSTTDTLDLAPAAFSSRFLPATNVSAELTTESIDRQIADLEKELRKLRFMKANLPLFQKRHDIEIKETGFTAAIRKIEEAAGVKLPLSIDPPASTTPHNFQYSGANIAAYDALAAAAGAWGYEIDFGEKEIRLKKPR